MRRYIIIAFMIGMFGSSCLILNKKQARAIDGLEWPIDNYTDTLISKYGTPIEVAGFQMQADTLREKLGSLDSLAAHISNKRAQELLQEYLMNCKAVYLLSLNPNLNGSAFAEVLGALSKNRARLRTVVNRRVR